MHVHPQLWRITRYSIFASIMALSACGKNAPPPPRPTAVDVFTVQTSQEALSTELPGRTTAYHIAEIRPQVSGLVNKRLFQEGSYVREGQSLYQIDPEIYQANYMMAKANLAKAEAALVSNRLLAERYRELIKSDAVSKQDYDNAQTAYQQSQADVFAAKANLTIAQINLKYSRVPAPISGKIGKSSVTQGALVTANQPQALSTVQQIDPIYVDLSQSNADILEIRRQLKAGEIEQAANSIKVELLLEDGSLYPVNGTLQFQDISVDPGTGTVALRAVFPNPQQQLLPGMFVKARIQTGVNPNAKLVPQQGITRTPQGDAIAMIMNAQGKAEPRPVKVAGMSGKNFIVIDGLRDGDKVITSGLLNLQPGTAVTTEKPNGQANAGKSKTK